MSIYETLGPVTESTHLIAVEVVEAAAKAGYPLGVLWGYSAASAAAGGEHGTGRALDFMVTWAPALNTSELRKAAGDFIADYLWQHRERLDLQHEIWWQRIRSTTNTPGVWRDLADRGSATQNHYDHVHAYFNGRYAQLIPQGQQGAPSSPVIVPAPPAGGILVVDGNWGSATSREVSKRLGITSVPENIGGSAITKLQAKFGTKQDGIVSGQKPVHHLFAWSQVRVKEGTGGSRLVKEMAANLEVNYYRTNGSDKDGLAGPGFVGAVQTRLNVDPNYLKG